MNTKLTYYTIALLLLLSEALSAQVSVSGRITGAADGQPLIGATVAIEGTSGGAISDIEGQFRLTAPSSEYVLVFSYTGMISKKEKIGSRSVIDVVLDENNALINEVVVVGYGSQKRSNISGAVSTVTAAEIAELPVLRVEQALQGMDLVTREEFEAVKAMAAAAREENLRISERLAELESRLRASGESA